MRESGYDSERSDWRGAHWPSGRIGVVSRLAGSRMWTRHSRPLQAAMDSVGSQPDAVVRDECRKLSL